MFINKSFCNGYIVISAAIVINGPQKIKKDEMLVLSCNATGGKSAPDDLDWIKDNRKLISDKSGKINITKHISYVTMTIISNLTIKKVGPDDAGVYECRTSDEMVKNVNVEVTGESSDKDKSRYSGVAIFLLDYVNVSGGFL